MGKSMNVSDLLKKQFSELTISEQAAVLRARYDEETSEPGIQKIKTRGTIGEEYGLSGSSVGRLLKMNDLIDPLKDIDGIVAAIMALDRCIRNQTEPQGSVYDERGLLIL